MINLQITKTNKIQGGGSEGLVVYYYRVIINDTVTITDLATTIAKRCTVQRADCEAAIVAFCQVIRELLLQSCSVKLNKIGTFRLTCRSAGQETPEAFDVRNVKSIKTNYLPDTGIKYYLDKSRLNFHVLGVGASPDPVPEPEP